MEQCAEVGALLIVDECFGGFLRDPDAHTLRGMLGDYPNLLLLKAFTKLYAMAGLRLGYCLSGDGTLLEPLRRRGILLRGCGNYSGLDDGWYRTAVRTAEENRRLAAALTEIVKEGN